MKPKLVQARLAPRLARRFAPRIIQQIGSVYDFIVPIHEGELQLRYIDQPTLYYRVTCDEENYYALYAVFHRKDYSTLPWPIKSLDEHEFDLEGILRVFSKKSGEIIWLASIFHKEILFAMPSSFYRMDAWIEAGGHGIVPTRHVNAGKGKFDDWQNTMEYFFTLHGNVEPINKPVWEKMYQPIFNPHGVNMPWQWGCEHLGEESKGLIYNDPAKLLEMAKARGRI